MADDAGATAAAGRTGAAAAHPAAATAQASAATTAGSAALVAAGGTLGVAVRALLEGAFPAGPGAWPWTTTAINLTGSLLLGLLLATLSRRGPDTGRRRAVRLGVGTGVIGGYTTYSTFVLEVERLVTGGAVATGVAYALVSVVLGVAAAGLGVVLGGGRGVARAEAGQDPDALAEGAPPADALPADAPPEDARGGRS